MKTIFWFIFLFFFVFIHAQEITNIQWQEDLDTLQSKLLQKKYLFHHFSKTTFNAEINDLKTNIDKYNNVEISWQLQKILSHFKLVNLNLDKTNIHKFPFYVKAFKNKFYLIKVNKEHSYLLAYKLVKINDVSIAKIISKMKTIFYLPHQNSVEKILEKWINNKSLLTHLNIIKKDSLKLSFKTKTNNIETISLSFINDFNQDDLINIKPNKELFNQRKKNVWFWKYGINFGKQVFLKYQVCASKEHITKMKDSLNMSVNDYAKSYKIPLQSIYDAPEINPFINLVVEKFKKRRYKKLIIDLRDNNKGAFLSTKRLIREVLKIKRINKKDRLFILTNKYTNAAAISTILSFKNQTKVSVIGETVFGTKEDSNRNFVFKLHHSKLKVNCPTSLQKEIIITPNILVKPTLNQYKKGVDAFLQKAL